MTDSSKYWKDRFSDEQLEGDKFFEPSNRVWYGISGALPRRGSGPLPWILIAGLLLLLLGTSGYFYTKMKAGDKALVQVRQDLADKKQKLAELQTTCESTLEELEELQTRSVNENDNVGPVNAGISPAVVSNTPSRIPISRNQKLVALSERLEGRKNQLFESKPISSNDLSWIIGASNLSKIPAEHRKGIIQQPLPFPELHAFDHSGIATLSIVELTAKERPVPFNRFWQVSAYTGFSTTSTAVNYSQDNVDLMEISLGDDRRWGFSVGLDLRRQLGRNIFIESGLGFNHFEFTSQYRLNIPYTHDTEYWRSGTIMENTFNHTLPSSMGNLRTNISVQRNAAAYVEEGEEVSLDFYVTQRLETITMPLYAGYAFNVGLFNLEVAGGLVANYHIFHDVTAQYLYSHHENVHHHQSAADLTGKDINNLTFNLGGFAGLEYLMKKDFTIYSRFNMQRGLNDIYETADYTTRLRHNFFMLGLRKSF